MVATQQAHEIREQIVNRNLIKKYDPERILIQMGELLGKIQLKDPEPLERKLIEVDEDLVISESQIWWADYLIRSLDLHELQDALQFALEHGYESDTLTSVFVAIQMMADDFEMPADAPEASNAMDCLVHLKHSMLKFYLQLETSIEVQKDLIVETNRKIKKLKKLRKGLS